MVAFSVRVFILKSDVLFLNDWQVALETELLLPKDGLTISK